MPFHVVTMDVFSRWPQRLASHQHQSQQHFWIYWWSVNPIRCPQLGPGFQELFAAGLVASSQRTYHTEERRYVVFCQTHKLQPFPASKPVLTAFAAKLYTQGLAAGIVKSYLAATCHAQIVIGLGDPRIGAMLQLEYVLKGLKRRTTRKER